MGLFSGNQDRNSNSLDFHNSWKVTREWELSDSAFVSHFTLSSFVQITNVLEKSKKGVLCKYCKYSWLMFLSYANCTLLPWMKCISAWWNVVVVFLFIVVWLATPLFPHAAEQLVCKEPGRTEDSVSTNILGAGQGWFYSPSPWFL